MRSGSPLTSMCRTDGGIAKAWRQWRSHRRYVCTLSVAFGNRRSPAAADGNRQGRAAGSGVAHGRAAGAEQLVDPVANEDVARNVKVVSELATWCGSGASFEAQEHVVPLTRMAGMVNIHYRTHGFAEGQLDELVKRGRDAREPARVTPRPR